METKYAEKANITLLKGKEKYFIRYDNTKDDIEKFVGIDRLPDEDIDNIMDFYNHWEQRSSGLFLPKNNVLCFVMIIESLFSDKYKIEYEWIGGADPYKAWKEEQENAPKDVVY